MLLQNGATYRVGSIPEVTYPPGQPIVLYTSFLFGNANTIRIVDKNQAEVSIGQFSNPAHIALLIFVTIAILGDLSFKNKISGIALQASFLVILIEILLYTFYY